MNTLFFRINNKQPRLKDKFIHEFLIIIILGILATVVFNAFTLFYFSSKFFRTKRMRKNIEELELNKTFTHILTAMELQKSTINSLLYTLEDINETYNFLTNLYFHSNAESKIQKDQMINLIEKYIFNIWNSTSDEVKNIINNTQLEFPYLDYARWYIDKDKQNLANLDDTYISELFILLNLIPFFRSFSEINLRRNTTTTIIIFYEENDLYFEYPFKNTFIEFYEKEMEQWCKTPDGKTPSYYYFKCTKLFYKSKQSYHQLNYRYIFGDVSTMNNSLNYFPLCLNVAEPNYKNINSENSNGKILICFFYELSLLWKQFDYLNSLVPGYFFIYTKKSNIPFYYPKRHFNKQIDSLVHNEFYLNSSYYLDELVRFFEVQSLLEESHVNINDLYSISSSFSKNQKIWNISIIPINYQLNGDKSDEQTKGHIQSVVYIFNTDQEYQFLNIEKTMVIENLFQLFSFFTIGISILFLFVYLVGDLANNIVKPIKTIKNVLMRINDKNKKIEKRIITKESNTSQSGNVVTEQSNANEENANLLQEKQIIERNFDDERSDDEEEDEKYINSRSEEVNTMFIKLVKLKNALKTLGNAELSLRDGNLINYISAKINFHEIGNEQASSVCSSNIGNLLSNYELYDKSIYHLMDSVKEAKLFIPKRINLEEIDSFKNFINKEALLANRAKNSREIENAKKIYLESRYPKLVYAFKKEIKDIKKLELYKEHEKIHIEKNAFFFDCKVNSPNVFGEILRDYLDLSLYLGDPFNASIALIEYLDFFLDYELKNRKSIEKFLHLKTLLPLKEDTEIQELKPSKTIKMVNVLDNLTDIENSTDYSQTPDAILVQRSNYIVGKFFFKCGHYKTSLDFFYESLKNELVCDAKVMKKAVHKIIKIGEKIKENIANDYLGRRGIYTEIEKSIDQYIISRTEQFKSLKFYPKDICVIVSPEEASNAKKQIESSLYIFENFVCDYDRFSLLFYPQYATEGKILLQLNFKEKDRQNYIYEYLKNYNSEVSGDEKIDVDYDKSKAEIIIQWGRNYLYKKSANIKKNKGKFIGDIREKWIIFLCSFLTKGDADYFKKTNIKEELFHNNNYSNLIIVVFTSLKTKSGIKINPENINEIWEGKEKYIYEVKKSLNCNKSDVILFDKLEKLKEKMQITGYISNKITFSQEKYNSLVPISDK